MVAPVQFSTRPAATSESGIEMALINATRHSKRKRIKISTTRRNPMTIARPRLVIEVSTKVAGRKISVSTAMPSSPGAMSLSAASTARVTSSVLPHGSFSTMSISPRPSLMTASPTSTEPGGSSTSTGRATSLR